MLKRNILELAGAVTQSLGIFEGIVVESATGHLLLSLAEIGRISYFRQDTLPTDSDVLLSVSASHAAIDKHYYMANGVQACRVEIDIETDFIKVSG